MKRPDPVAALEIGTSRTVLAIGEPLGNDRVRVSAKGAIPSTGVRKSQIVDVGQAGFSVESVLHQVEQNDGYTIAQACLAVNGPHVRALRCSTQWQLQGKTVTEADISEIYNRSFENGLDPDKRATLDVAEFGYGLDDLDGIDAPKGMSGRLLKLYTLCVHGDRDRIADARAAADHAKLAISETAFAGFAAANAVLTPQDRAAGTLVIDLGGGSTSCVVCADGHFLHANVIGVGGDHVTNDLRLAFSLTQHQAESLKIAHARATLGRTEPGERVEVPANSALGSNLSISRRALDVVVNARIRELFSVILDDLDRAGLMHRLNGGIVLTGGGAALAEVDALATSVFGRPARRGTLVPEIEGLDAEPHPELWATVAGLLLMARRSATPSSLFSPISNILGGIFRK